MPVPPYTHTTLSPRGLENFLHSLVICRASSRVGVMITAVEDDGTVIYMKLDYEYITLDALSGFTTIDKLLKSTNISPMAFAVP